jgi:hypothetical protein
VALRRFARAYGDPPENTTIWSRFSGDRANFATIRQISRRSTRRCDDRGGRFDKPPRLATMRTRASVIHRILRRIAADSLGIWADFSTICRALRRLKELCGEVRRFSAKLGGLPR